MAAPPQQPSAWPAQPPSAVPGADTRGGGGGADMAVPPQPPSAVTAQPPGLAYRKTMVQRPSGLWEEARVAAPGPGPQAAPPAAPQPPGPGAQALPPPALLDYDDLLAANQQQVAPGWIKGASGQWIWADVGGWRWTYARGWRQDVGYTDIIVAATVVAREACEAREGARWD